MPFRLSRNSGDSDRGANTFASFPIGAGGMIPQTNVVRQSRAARSASVTTVPVSDNFAAREVMGGASQGPPVSPFNLMTPAMHGRSDTQLNKAMGSGTGSSPAFLASVNRSRAVKQYRGGVFASMREQGASERQAAQRAYSESQLADADLQTGGAFTDRTVQQDANARENDVARSNVQAQDTGTATAEALRAPVVQGANLQNQRTAAMLPPEVAQAGNQVRAGQLANQRAAAMIPPEVQAAGLQNQQAARMGPIVAQQGQAQANATNAQAAAAVQLPPYLQKQIADMQKENAQLRAQLNQQMLGTQRENATMRAAQAKADANDPEKQVERATAKSGGTVGPTVGETLPGTGGQDKGPTQADFEHTAAKYGITIDEVKRRMGIQGTPR